MSATKPFGGWELSVCGIVENTKNIWFNSFWKEHSSVESRHIFSDFAYLLPLDAHVRCTNMPYSTAHPVYHIVWYPSVSLQRISGKSSARVSLYPDRVMTRNMFNIPDFKHSPCCECCVLSFEWFPGVWILCADVSEHSACSVFIGVVITPPMKIEQSVPKRRHIKFRRRRITQNKEYKM